MNEKFPCMSCKQHLASVKLTKIVQGNVEEVYLCQECAAKQSPYQKKLLNPLAGMTLDAILAGILGQQEEAGAKPGSVELQCSTCGLPFDSYRGTLILGCSGCYESFEKHLLSDLRKFHGSTVHRGRVPDGGATVLLARRNPEELKRRMQEAVKAEDYELAARLRDEMRELETQESETSTALKADADAGSEEN